MNNAISCPFNPAGEFRIEYNPGDNTHVAPGTYEGAFEIELRRWGDHQPSERIRIRADIHIPSR